MHLQRHEYRPICEGNLFPTQMLLPRKRGYRAQNRLKNRGMPRLQLEREEAGPHHCQRSWWLVAVPLLKPLRMQLQQQQLPPWGSLSQRRRLHCWLRSATRAAAQGARQPSACCGAPAFCPMQVVPPSGQELLIIFGVTSPARTAAIPAIPRPATGM